MGMVEMKNQRNLLIFFASVVPEGISKKRKRERIKDYSRSLAIISEFAKKLDFDIHVVENTLGSLSNWISSGLYTEKNITFSFLLENSGRINKGIGELDMAQYVLSQLDVKIYKKIIWFSGRHILTSEGILRFCLSAPADIVVSNPDFYFIDGDLVKSEKEGLLNDMMFAMSSNTFKEYISFFKASRIEMIQKNIGSEQHLYQFVNLNTHSIEWMIQIGVLRRDNRIKWRFFETSQWHFC